MKKLLFSLLMMIGVQASFAQTLEKMQWFNEPEQWEIKDKSLSMFVTPQSDYWRISHYGFTLYLSILFSNVLYAITDRSSNL